MIEICGKLDKSDTQVKLDVFDLANFPPISILKSD